MEKFLLCLVVFAAVGCAQLASVQAFDHIVGGSLGWTQPDHPTFYEEWAKPRTFGLGDKLVFPYRPSVQNIVQVPKEEFENCSMSHPINMFYDGPTVITLDTLGDRYYYCGVGTHCEAGQKLAITVVDAPGTSGKVSVISAIAEAPAPGHSAAVSIRNVGVGGGLLLSALVSLFI